MVGVAVHDTVGPDHDADVSERPLSPSEQESVHAEGSGQVLPVAEASIEDLEIEVKDEEEVLDVIDKEDDEENADHELDPNTQIPFLNLLSTEISEIKNSIRDSLAQLQDEHKLLGSTSKISTFTRSELDFLKNIAKKKFTDTDQPTKHIESTPSEKSLDEIRE